MVLLFYQQVSAELVLPTKECLAPAIIIPLLVSFFLYS